MIGMASPVKERIQSIRGAIAAACEKARRDPAAVRIVAISKGFGPDAIREAAEAGIKAFGENYLQESDPKQAALGDLSIEWHFTGHVQRNKARRVAERFALVHGVDSLRLAEALDAAGKELGKTIPALIQIKGNPNGYGFSWDEIFPSAGKLAKLDRLDLRGIMMVAPPADNPEESRQFFKKGGEVFFRLRDKLPAIKELSMGMTDDFPVAVEEGATIVRIGRGIFGERIY